MGIYAVISLEIMTKINALTFKKTYRQDHNLNPNVTGFIMLDLNMSIKLNGFKIYKFPKLVLVESKWIRANGYAFPLLILFFTKILRRRIIYPKKTSQILNKYVTISSLWKLGRKENFVRYGGHIVVCVRAEVQNLRSNNHATQKRDSRILHCSTNLPMSMAREHRLTS